MGLALLIGLALMLVPLGHLFQKHVGGMITGLILLADIAWIASCMSMYGVIIALVPEMVTFQVTKIIFMCITSAPTFFLMLICWSIEDEQKANKNQDGSRRVVMLP